MVRIKIFIALTFACASFSACGSDATRGRSTVIPVDTAMLFPLPASVTSSRLIRATDSGARGPLVPGYAWSEIPALGTAGLSNAELRASLQMVSVNIDPCFPDGAVADQSLCRNQVRMIFQPVVDSGGSVTTLDATVHTFYDMPRDEFRAMVEELLAIDGQTGVDPMSVVGVHPRMRSEGPGGEFASAVQDVLLAHTGQSYLTKVTFSALRGTGIGWQMGGTDYEGSTATTMVIPASDSLGGNGSVRQELINNALPVKFTIDIDPETEFSRSMEPLFNSDAARGVQPQTLTAAIEATLDLDNPDSGLNPGNVDCASCHVATPLREWAARELGTNVSANAHAYTSQWNLSLVTETGSDTGTTRCFGYYGDRVSVSQRTVNEAAAVTDYINAKILGE